MPQIDNQTFLLHGESEMRTLCTELSTRIPPGSTIGLSGELGAGKTAFVRYFCEAMNCLEPVSSPSFVLQHEYQLAQGVCEHWDLYRVHSSPDELFEKPGKHDYRFIEWFERCDTELRDLLDFIIRISIIDSSSRKVEFKACPS